MTRRFTTPAVGIVALVAVCVAGVVAWLAADRRRDDDVERSAIDADTVVLLGDSITAAGSWPDLLPGRRIANEGYPGATTDQLVSVAERIAAQRPSAVYVLAGTNDVRDGLTGEHTTAALELIVDAFEANSPETRIVLQTVLPRAETADAITATNRAIEAFAEQRGIELIDLHAAFDDGSGGLEAADTTEGWHLSERGYRRWADVLSRFFDDGAG